MNNPLCLLAVLLLFGGCASRQPVYNSTDLTIAGGIPDGYVWNRENGPDFDVWRATSAANEKPIAGVYVGGRPSYSRGSGTVTDGHFGSRRVKWEHSQSGLRADTLFTHDPGPCYGETKIHVWAAAETQSDLTQLLSSLTSA